jgi:hypothetical protein
MARRPRRLIELASVAERRAREAAQSVGSSLRTRLAFFVASNMHSRLNVLAAHLRGGDSLSSLCSSSAAAGSSAEASLTVCFCTHEGGPHVQSYLDGLRDTPEVTQVALSDPTGHWVQAARETLGDRLTSVHTDALAMLAEVKPGCAVVAYEAVLAPPVVRAALEAGCHVLAEKPACVSIDAIDELVVLASKQQRQVRLAAALRFVFMPTNYISAARSRTHQSCLDPSCLAGR